MENSFYLLTHANQVLKIDAQTKATEVYLSQTRGANGLAFDLQQNPIMKVDENGLLFCAAANKGVWIFSPEGEFVDQINVELDSQFR